MLETPSVIFAKINLIKSINHLLNIYSPLLLRETYALRVENYPHKSTLLFPFKTRVTNLSCKKKMLNEVFRKAFQWSWLCQSTLPLPFAFLLSAWLPGNQRWIPQGWKSSSKVGGESVEKEDKQGGGIGNVAEPLHSSRTALLPASSLKWKGNTFLSCLRCCSSGCSTSN